jgi:hypothetical protein
MHWRKALVGPLLFANRRFRGHIVVTSASIGTDAAGPVRTGRSRS